MEKIKTQTNHKFVWVLIEHVVNSYQPLNINESNTIGVYTDCDHAKEVQDDYEYLAEEDNRKAIYSVEKYYLNIKGEK